MIESLASSLAPVLDTPYIRRTRRNHGLEHATVHILSETIKNRPLAGRSDAAGFWLLGDVETPVVEKAIAEALRRMKAGERNLAVHPGCGTARLTTATIAGLAALTGTIGARRSLGGVLMRLPTIILLTMVAILYAEPLGMQLQEHITTSAEIDNMEIIKVEKSRTRVGSMLAHRITTTSP